MPLAVVLGGCLFNFGGGGSGWRTFVQLVGRCLLRILRDLRLKRASCGRVAAFVDTQSLQTNVANNMRRFLMVKLKYVKLRSIQFSFPFLSSSRSPSSAWHSLCSISNGQRRGPRKLDPDNKGLKLLGLVGNLVFGKF